MVRDKEQTLAAIRTAGVVAVIRGSSPEMAVETAKVLVSGGITGIEIA